MIHNPVTPISLGDGGGATVMTSVPFAIAAHTGTGAGTAYALPSGKVTIQASSDASHTGTSTVTIEVSNDGTLWLTLGAISVTGNSASDGFVSDAPWSQVRSNCSAHGDSTNVVTVTVSA